MVQINRWEQSAPFLSSPLPPPHVPIHPQCLALIQPAPCCSTSALKVSGGDSYSLALATADNTNEGFVAPECAFCTVGVGRSGWWKAGWGGEKVYGLTGRYSSGGGGGGGFWWQGFSCFSKLGRNNPDIMTLWTHKNTRAQHTWCHFDPVTSFTIAFRREEM